VSSGKHAFKETDVKRAIRAVQAMGLPVVKVEIGTDGKIVVVNALESAQEETRSALDDWKARKNARQAKGA
jgi:fructose/tagatose bisphosphate aldolase